MDKEQRLKGIMYRSNYRGCKETDILIGKFAKELLSELNDDKLQLFESLISEDDAHIYDWIMSATQPPEKYQSLIANIRQFHDL